MTSQESEVFTRLLRARQDERDTLCIDGDSSFQRGFFMGYEWAQRLVESANASLRVKS